MTSFASAFPLLPGKAEQWKQFNHEMIGSRRSEFEAFLQRQGVTREVVALQQTPQGDMVVVYFEAPDIAHAFEVLGSSQEPFDVWFREQAKDTTGIDFSQPASGPLPEIYIDWQAK
jgi:hypothetical protein